METEVKQVHKINTSGQLGGAKNNLAIGTRPDPFFTGTYSECDDAL